MAQKSGSNQPDDELRIEIARSRERMARDLGGLRYELDFPRKIRRSFQNQTGGWIAAAVVVGTILVLLPLRKKTVYIDLKSGTKAKPKSKLIETGFLLGALRIAVTLLRPTIANFVTRRFSSYAAGNRRKV